MRAAQGGDQAAFRALYDAHFDLVYRTCRRLGLPDADAEDAAQETFIVAARKLDRFSEGKLSTWLYRIAANLVSARHRRRRVREALTALWRRPEEPVAPSAERSYEAREAARRVGEILATMAPKKREVFALFELEGLTGEEIAERVGCKVETVWTRLWHARRDFERIARKRGLLEEAP
ncbi:MAG TPA: sigma-70 family RNA polymerase sigma factor [Myxococcales bacterium]